MERTYDAVLADILADPLGHMHTFDELKSCCTIAIDEPPGYALSLMLIDAHSYLVTLGTNRGVQCDTVDGPCSCDAWHKLSDPNSWPGPDQRRQRGEIVEP